MANSDAQYELEDEYYSYTESDEDWEASDEDSDAAVNHGGDSDEEPSFPQFTCLPPEFRFYIWEQYCPEFTAHLRIVELELAWKNGMETLDNSMVFAGYSLQGSTRRIPKLLAVHRESRIARTRRESPPGYRLLYNASCYSSTSLPRVAAGKSYPIITGIVRFRKETDIIVLENLIDEGLLQDDNTVQGVFTLSGFADAVRHVAIYFGPSSDASQLASALEEQLPEA